MAVAVRGTTIVRIGNLKVSIRKASTSKAESAGSTAKSNSSVVYRESSRVGILATSSSQRKGSTESSTSCVVWRSD